jgi:hypothetical protein
MEFPSVEAACAVGKVSHANSCSGYEATLIYPSIYCPRANGKVYSKEALVQPDCLRYPSLITHLIIILHMTSPASLIVVEAGSESDSLHAGPYRVHPARGSALGCDSVL